MSFLEFTVNPLTENIASGRVGEKMVTIPTSFIYSMDITIDADSGHLLIPDNAHTNNQLMSAAITINSASDSPVKVVISKLNHSRLNSFHL
jgi:hypothetical protein